MQTEIERQPQLKEQDPSGRVLMDFYRPTGRQMLGCFLKSHPKGLSSVNDPFLSAFDVIGGA